MTTTPTSGAADLRTTFSEMLVDLPNTEPFTLFKAGFDAALAAGQATAAQAVVQDNLITIRKPTTSAEMLWLLKLAHLVISDVDKALEETFAPAQPAAPQGVAYAALPAPNYPKSGGFPGTFAEAQMRAFADATHALRASHGQAPAKPDPAYSAACHLATALFKKHFAHLPDFASGQAVWSLCGSTAGVISQIDNMVSGLVQPPTTAFSEDEL